MPKTQLNRSFPGFDPAVHVVAEVDVSDPVNAVLLGLDVGSGAPCVSLLCHLMRDRSLVITNEHRRTDCGLVKFIELGCCAQPAVVDLVCTERSCIARNIVTNESPHDVLTNAGFSVLQCKSSPKWRWKAINARLGQGKGAGGLIVHRECKHAIETLIGHRSAFGSRGGYRTTTPETQHCVDALGYAVEGAARWGVCENVRPTGIAIDAIA